MENTVIVYSLQLQAGRALFHIWHHAS